MSDTKPTIIHISGGETFTSKEDFYAYQRSRTCEPFEEKKRWRFWLKERFDSVGWPFIIPDMPAKDFADYTAWSIRFEKHIPFMSPVGVILIGHSLGGVFLAKWLCEKKLSVPIHQLHLVAAPFDNNELAGGEDLGEFQVNGRKLMHAEQQIKTTHIWHSDDDFVVPFSHSEKYMSRIPGAVKHDFKDKNHFLDAEFPELLDCIYQRDQ